MNVVIVSVNFNRVTFEFSTGARQIKVKLPFNRNIDHRLSVFGTENNVEEFRQAKPSE